MAFKDRIAAYNSQKETKVNPPEAKTVLETKSAPEVEAKAPPATSAAAPEPSVETSAATAAGTAEQATAGTTEGKARRGRPAGSKNKSSAQPEPAATAPGSLQQQADVDQVLSSFTVEQLCQELACRGFITQLTTATARDLRG